MEDVQRFRVLIVGGSVVGLTLANALERAGIDFLVLERKSIAPHIGASISVLCHTAKVFEQLGIWDTIRNATLPLTDRQHFDLNGRLFEDSSVLRLILEQTKRPFLFMERKFYLQTLYNNIKDKTKVRSDVCVTSFEESDGWVEVVTNTGETIRGNMLVGADGIHSTTRRLMADNICKSDPKHSEELTGGFVASYKTIFGTSINQYPNIPDKLLLPPGMVHNVYYRNVSGIAAAGVEGLVFWFLFVKLNRPQTTPNIQKYSNADAKEMIDEYGHLRLGSGYTFKDLWNSKVEAALVPMEEGVLEGPWNNGGRVVLMGDAVSKSTINVGLGGNTAIEGVCHFSNELVSLIRKTQNPTTKDIVTLCESYESKQRPRASLCVKLSGYVTRYEAMDTWWLRLLRLISPWIPDRFKANGFLDFMAPAPIFNFLPDPDSVSR